MPRETSRPLRCAALDLVTEMPLVRCCEKPRTLSMARAVVCARTTRWANLIQQSFTAGAASSHIRRMRCLMAINSSHGARSYELCILQNKSSLAQSPRLALDISCDGRNSDVGPGL